MQNINIRAIAASSYFNFNCSFASQLYFGLAISVDTFLKLNIVAKY